MTQSDERPPRVLHVQDHGLPLHSGYAFRSRYIVAGQRSLGIDAQVVTSARHTDFDAPSEEVDGIRFHRTSMPQGGLDGLLLKAPFVRERPMTLALGRRILEVAEAFQPDLLHAHSPMFDGLAALWAAERLKVPVVYEIRAFWEDDAVDKKKISETGLTYKGVRWLEEKAVRGANHVITICEGLRQDLISRGFSGDKISLVPNGVDPERFQPIERDESLAQKLGLAGKQVLGFIGSFLPYEGLEMLVRAFAKLAPDHPDAALLLVGGGESVASVDAIAEASGFADRIIRTGRVPHSEVAAHYGIIDLLVYPRTRSRLTETVTPLKPLEAIAMGRSVLGSDVGGIAELLAVAEDATRAFPADSDEGLENALRDFLATPEATVAAERKRAREAVLAERSWIANVRRILPVYRRLIGHPIPGDQALA